MVDTTTCTKGDSPGMASGGHSAAPSAAGYLYQVRWALLNLLREGRTRPEQIISLEMHDDVSWQHEDGGPTELLQTVCRIRHKRRSWSGCGIPGRIRAGVRVGR